MFFKLLRQAEILKINVKPGLMNIQGLYLEHTPWQNGGHYSHLHTATLVKYCGKKGNNRNTWDTREKYPSIPPKNYCTKLDGQTSYELTLYPVSTKIHRSCKEEKTSILTDTWEIYFDNSSNRQQYGLLWHHK